MPTLAGEHFNLGATGVLTPEAPASFAGVEGGAARSGAGVCKKAQGAWGNSPPNLAPPAGGCYSCPS
jgi:hypothetical protein